jgi:hypothetical protein
LIEACSNTLHFDNHKLTNSTWNKKELPKEHKKELPQEQNKSITFINIKKYNKTEPVTVAVWSEAWVLTDWTL